MHRDLANFSSLLDAPYAYTTYLSTLKASLYNLLLARLTMDTPHYHPNMSDFAWQTPIPVVPEPQSQSQGQGQGQEQGRGQQPGLSRQQRRARRRDNRRDSRRNNRNNATQRQFEQRERIIERLDFLSAQLSILISKAPDTWFTLGGSPTAAAATAAAEHESSTADFASFDLSDRRDPTPPTTQQDTTTGGYPPPSEAPEPDELDIPLFYPEVSSPSVYEWPDCYDYADMLGAESQSDIRGGDTHSNSRSGVARGCSPPKPSPVGSPAAATLVTPEDALRLLASTFYLLELDLLETRRRLQDLRDVVARPAHPSYALLPDIHDTVKTVVDGLESAIDQDLDRLFFLNAVQERAGLTTMPVPTGSISASVARSPQIVTASASAAAVATITGTSGDVARPSLSSLATATAAPTAAQLRYSRAPRSSPPPGLSRVAVRTSPTTIPVARPRYGDVSSDHEGWTYVASDPDWSVFGGEPTTPVIPSTVAGGRVYRLGRAERQRQQQRHETMRTLPHRSRFVPSVF